MHQTKLYLCLEQYKVKPKNYYFFISKCLMPKWHSGASVESNEKQETYRWTNQSRLWVTEYINNIIFVIHHMQDIMNHESSKMRVVLKSCTSEKIDQKIFKYFIWKGTKLLEANNIYFIVFLSKWQKSWFLFIPRLQRKYTLKNMFTSEVGPFHYLDLLDVSSNHKMYELLL